CWPTASRPHHVRGSDMRLVTLADGRVGKIVDDRFVDLTDLAQRSTLHNARMSGSMRSLIEGWDDVRDEATRRAAPSTSMSAVRLDAPVPDPSKVLAAPVNYVDHQLEMSVTSQVDSLGLFLKSPSS